MSPQTRQGVFALAGIFATRMLGMFLLLPVLAVATEHLPGSTPLLAGIALGIYGLFQAALQIPFGLLSDRYGRKKIMTIGLLLFLFGSLVAALSSNMIGLILGRALQGMGAIGSTTLAYIADITPEEDRSQAMAIVGLQIAGSFGLAMLTGPIIYQYIGLDGIFWVTSAMAGLSLCLLYFAIPTPEHEVFHRDTSVNLKELAHILTQKELLRLDFGIFTLHTLLSASFLVIPNMIAQLQLSSSASLYAPVLLGSLPIMLVGTYLGEKKRIIKAMLTGLIITLILSISLLFSQVPSFVSICSALLAFFAAFGLGESFLPSLVSKTASATSKGTAMGVFSSAQFLGSFAGGYFGGIAIHYFDTHMLFIGMLTLSVIWLILTINMHKPSYLSTYLTKINQISESQCIQLEQYLLSCKGLYEAKIMHDDSIAYLKFDSKIVNRSRLASIIADWLRHNPKNEE